jgi:signal peptidase II
MPHLPLARPHRLKSRFLLISLAVLVVDQWSKAMVERHLPLHRSITIIPGCLDFTHVSNTGVAFGLLPAHGELAGTLLLTLLGLVALGVIGYYFLRAPLDHRLLLTALSLVLGGAVGNLLDRVAAGAVTDFIDFYVGSWHWHTFNVADSAITVGVVLMAYELLLTRRQAARSQADPAA